MDDNYLGKSRYPISKYPGKNVNNDFNCRYIDLLTADV
jgi:hypothetical protein